MLETKAEMIGTISYDPVLKLDLKDWLKKPITKIFMKILGEISENQKLELINFVDNNLMISGEQLKASVAANHAAREILEHLTNKEQIITDFENYGYLIKEGAENDD